MIQAGQRECFSSVRTPSVGRPSVRTDLDAFGRPGFLYAHEPRAAQHGPITTTSFHAASTTVCDPLDNAAGTHFHVTCSTSRTDGFVVISQGDPEQDEVTYDTDQTYIRTSGNGGITNGNTEGASETALRPSALYRAHDWLGNMQAWDDDSAVFYERSLGDIVNGADLPTEAPSRRTGALYVATNLPAEPDTADDGGWVEVRYGEDGNALSVTVHGRCGDPADNSIALDERTPTDDDTDEAYALWSVYSCATEQHYTYAWDEVNRIALARRFDREDSGDWELAVEQRYLYDASNQRTLKTTTFRGAESGTERTALYVYPGDFERRGLVTSMSGTSYDAVSGDTETQYGVGGARIVWRDGDRDDTLDRDQRVTIALTDLIQSTTAVIDLATGELVESGSYYANGARETYRSNETETVTPEPMGFTGKEADEEVGLTYFGHRYLMAHLGRWASPDPLQTHAVGGGEAVNGYHYVSGNLLQARDPLGLWEIRSSVATPAGGRASAFTAGPEEDHLNDGPGSGSFFTGFGTFSLMYSAAPGQTVNDVHFLQFLSMSMSVTTRDGRVHEIRGSISTSRPGGLAAGGVRRLNLSTSRESHVYVDQVVRYGPRRSGTPYYDLRGSAERSTEHLSMHDAPTEGSAITEDIARARRQVSRFETLTVSWNFVTYAVTDSTPDSSAGSGAPTTVLARYDVVVTETWSPGRGSVGPSRLGRTIAVNGVAVTGLSLTADQERAIGAYYERWRGSQARGALAPNPAESGDPPAPNPGPGTTPAGE